MLPKDIAKLVPKDHLMSEQEWRGIGVQQSQGWVHYMKHDPGTGCKIHFLQLVQGRTCYSTEWDVSALCGAGTSYP